jgi:hypothetical protein
MIERSHCALINLDEEYVCSNDKPRGCEFVGKAERINLSETLIL